MILHYYKSAAGNFGDDLNAWLWERLLPGCWHDDGIYFAGIGTILTDAMPRARSWVVLGSGAGYGPPPEGFGGPHWSIMSVRGPLSARVLNLPAEKAVTDGAQLVNQMPEYLPLPEQDRAGIVFVPHHQALEAGNWREVCRRTGIEYLDPTCCSQDVIARIRRARLVIADAMHAAIIADALRVPWLPVATSLEINTFKWLDWTESIEMPYRPTMLPASTFGEALRSATLHLHGQRYFVMPPTTQAALDHYRRSVALKRRRWWPTAQRLGERVYFSGIKRVIRRTGGSAWSRDARFDAAAEALRQVTLQSPYLSVDQVWRRRTMQLVEDVERLRTFFS